MRNDDGVAQVWLRREPVRKERVTRERITDAAVALLDEEGADRLTMRRLAERLDTGSTTLYGHVRTKEDVLDLALDAVFGEVPIPAAPGADWRDDLTALMRDWRAALLRHPWSATFLARPTLGPNALAREEFLHSLLVRAGLTAPRLVTTAYGLSNYVIGAVQMQVSWETRSDDARRAADDRIRGDRDRYPLMAEYRGVLENDWDASFVDGLECFLDGMRYRMRPGQ